MLITVHSLKVKQLSVTSHVYTNTQSYIIRASLLQFIYYLWISEQLFCVFVIVYFTLPSIYRPYPFFPYTSRRQSSACTNDIAQLTTSKYRTCIATFRNLGNLGHFSNSTLDTYCNMDCSNYLWNLLIKLARDCDPSNPVSHMTYIHVSVSLVPRVLPRLKYRKAGRVWYIIAHESMIKFSE